jgi:tetratricopeptide (TPR) repeat protein
MSMSPFSDVLMGDGRSYDAWAGAIVAGDWVGHGVFYQAPLYPYFLAAIYGIRQSLPLVRAVQAVVGAGACALLSYSVAQWFGRRAGLAAGLALAVYAPALFAGTLIQKSVLDLFFGCLLLALMGALATDPQRRWLWTGAGLALGALSLTRENALLFVPLIFGWVWVGQHVPRGVRPQMLLAFLAGLAIVLVPVGLRNRIVGGEFHFTTAQSGTNLFIGNNPRADGAYVPLRPGRGSPEYEQIDATALAEQATGRRLTPGEVSRYWSGRAFEYIRAEPLGWLALEGRKFRLLSNAAEVIDTESQESHADYSVVLRLAGGVGHFGVLAPLAALGLWMTWRDWRRLWILHAMIAAYVASVLAFYVVARYRLPLAPFLIMFAGAALVEGFAFLRACVPAERLAVGIAVSLVALFCNWPIVSTEAMRGATYRNLGAALQEDGRLDNASAAYREALRFNAGDALAHEGLGSVLRGQGRIDEAVAHLEEAVRLNTGLVETRFNLANALVARGDLNSRNGAIALYEEVLRQQSDAMDPRSNVDVHSNLGLALIAAGRLDEAIDRFRRASQLEPRSATTHYNLGHALFTRGDLAEATAQLAAAVEIEPVNLSARYELGNVYLAQQQFGAAAAQYREAVRLSPTFADAHNNLGVALASLGHVDEATEEFRQALRIDPSIVSAQRNLDLALGAAGARRR